MYSCAKQYGTVLCSHNQGGSLASSACGQSVDFISQYELMTHEQSQFLHLVKSSIVQVPPHSAVSAFQPGTAEHSLLSWTAADPSQPVEFFPNTTTCSGFTSPGRDAAGLALHTLLRSWCQTLSFLVTPSLSIWPAEPVLDSLWSQAESQIFPFPIPTQEGLHCCLMQPSAAGICNRAQGCFRLKLSRVPSPKYYMAQIFTALSSLSR